MGETLAKNKQQKSVADYEKLVDDFYETIANKRRKQRLAAIYDETQKTDDPALQFALRDLYHEEVTDANKMNWMFTALIWLVVVVVLATYFALEQFVW